MEDLKNILNKWDENLESKTPDELKALCKNILVQNYQLTNTLNQERDKTMFKRLDYLFAIISNSAAFPEDFIKKCTTEIMEVMEIEETKE